MSNDTMKRILLTGAGGFMGSHILRHLLINTDWHIVCLDSFRHKGLTDRISSALEGLDNSRITVISHDLTVPISPIMAGRIGQIDYVINTASESHVDRSIEEPRDFIENNVQLILTMLDYIREYPVEKFIQISTDEVYGPAGADHKHKEGEPHKPSNPYSASKSAQEAICYAYWRTYGLPICITNTMNIIGELQDSEKYVIKTIKQVMNGETVTVHAAADGTIGSRFYIHARNQADALLFILRNIDFNRYGNGDITRYNVVGDIEVNNLELAKKIAAYVGKPLKYKLVDFHTSRPGHDLRYALDGSKLAAAGWKAPLSLWDSLQQTVEWTIAHPEWLV